MRIGATGSCSALRPQQSLQMTAHFPAQSKRMLNISESTAHRFSTLSKRGTRVRVYVHNGLVQIIACVVAQLLCTMPTARQVPRSRSRVLLPLSHDPLTGMHGAESLLDAPLCSPFRSPPHDLLPSPQSTLLSSRDSLISTPPHENLCRGCQDARALGSRAPGIGAQDLKIGREL